MEAGSLPAGIRSSNGPASSKPAAGPTGRSIAQAIQKSDFSQNPIFGAENVTASQKKGHSKDPTVLFSVINNVRSAKLAPNSKSRI
jgi:hypothetical protein